MSHSKSASQERDPPRAPQNTPRSPRKRSNTTVRETSPPAKRRQSDAREGPVMRRQRTANATAGPSNSKQAPPKQASSAPATSRQRTRAATNKRSNAGRVPQTASLVQRPPRLPATAIQIPNHLIPPSLINVCEFDPDELEMPGTHSVMQIYHHLDQALLQISDLRQQLDVYRQAHKNTNPSAPPDEHCVRCHKSYSSSENHNFACRISHTAPMVFHGTRRQGGSWWLAPCCQSLAFSSSSNHFEGGHTPTYCRVSCHTNNPWEVDYHHHGVVTCREKGCPVPESVNAGPNGRPTAQSVSAPDGRNGLLGLGRNVGPVNGNMNVSTARYEACYCVGVSKH